MATTDNSPAAQAYAQRNQLPATIGNEALFQLVESVDRESALMFAQTVLEYMRERCEDAVGAGDIKGNEAAVFGHLLVEVQAAYRAVGAVV